MQKLPQNTTAVITGATSGIGFALAKHLVEAGAYVIGVGRSHQRNNIAKEKILSEIPDGKMDYVYADLAQPQMVRDLAQNVEKCLTEKGFSHLDILVNNAGVYLERKEKTVDGIEKTFAVNHLAQFCLTYYLRPLLDNSHNGRMISVSSYAHFNTPINLNRIADPIPYIGLLAYKRSKLCNVLFVRELRKRTSRFSAYAADPGLVNTLIGSKSGPGISGLVWSLHRKNGVSPETSAKDLLYIITAEDLDLSDGVYFKERKAIQPSKNARNDQLAERLWDLSCELTGLDW